MLVFTQRWNASEPSKRRLAAGPQRRFLELLGVLDEFRPARIGRQSLALFQHQFLEFLDPQILNQKLDSRAVAIFLFAEPREDAGDRLRQRQQFFRRNKRVEQLRLIRNGAESAADVHFKAALFFSVFGPRGGDHAHVVHARQAAGMLRAAAERRLEFSAEILACPDGPAGISTARANRE